MTRTKCTIRRDAWVSLCAALVLVSLAGAQAPGLTPTNASVQVSTISQTDPHPTTYNWEGDVPVVKEPGANYYAFYYTGTVLPDARVPQDSQVQRVPVKVNDWTNNKRWIIAQLTLYYQQSHNLPATALQEYQAGPQAENAIPGAPPTVAQPAAPGGAGAAPGGPQLGGPGVPPGPGGPGVQPQSPEQPQGGGVEPENPTENTGEGEDMREESPQPNNPAGPNAGPNLTASGFDPKNVAEWTFYYDQLVLWQYYCARQLLKGQDDLLETLPPSQRGQQQQVLVSQISGMTPQSIRASAIRESQRQAQMNQMQGQNNMGGMGGMSGSYMGEESMDMMGGGGQMSGATGPNGLNPVGPDLTGIGAAALREKFDPVRDYTNQLTGQKSKAEEYREKFQNAAKQLDDQVYSQFMEMIKGIDKRQVDNENYDKWIKNKRQEVSNYADTWRKLEHGETMMIDDTMFVVSKEKLDSVPNQTVNIIKRERLTPADFVNTDGSIRKPEIK